MNFLSKLLDFVFICVCVCVCVCVCMCLDFIVGAILDSQQNLVEGTESSHIFSDHTRT